MKKCIIVSFNGLGNEGGVERVSQYISEILGQFYEVQVMKMLEFHLPKFDYFFQALIMSLRLWFVKKDIVVSNSWQAFLYPCDISFAHGTTQGYMQRIGVFKKLSGAGIIAWMEKMSAKRAKKVLAVSAHVKEELSQLYHIPKKKIGVLLNCVDDLLYVPKDRHSFTNKVILFCGRLETGKGLSYLKKLSDYLDTISGWEMHIASNTRINEELFSLNKNTHISWGLVADDMPDFYADGDILFFPSMYEGFSMATLEALSSGIPVMGTDFVVTEELKEFQFCKNISQILESPPRILECAEFLIEEWRQKKNDIHKIISKRFGKDTYIKSFLSFIVKDI